MVFLISNHKMIVMIALQPKPKPFRIAPIHPNFFGAKYAVTLSSGRVVEPVLIQHKHEFIDPVLEAMKVERDAARRVVTNRDINQRDLLIQQHHEARSSGIEAVYKHAVDQTIREMEDELTRADPERTHIEPMRKSLSAFYGTLAGTHTLSFLHRCTEKGELPYEPEMPLHVGYTGDLPLNLKHLRDEITARMGINLAQGLHTYLGALNRFKERRFEPFK
jgi:hypothetical protein